MRKNSCWLPLTAKHVFKFAFISICFISFSSSGQIQVHPGYIVSSSRDTVSGFIENRSKGSNQKQCYFRKTRGDKSKVYGPMEIIGYGLTGVRYYEAVSIKDSQGNPSLIF